MICGYQIFNGDLLFQTVCCLKRTKSLSTIVMCCCDLLSLSYLTRQHGELEHLALIEKCVGLFPMSMIRKSKYEAEFFSR